MLTCDANSHAISLATNYRLFAHRDVSYRFRGGGNDIVLEFDLSREFKNGTCVSYKVYDVASTYGLDSLPGLTKCLSLHVK